jgi:hypothetical protein
MQQGSTTVTVIINTSKKIITGGHAIDEVDRS